MIKQCYPDKHSGCMLHCRSVTVTLAHRSYRYRPHSWTLLLGSGHTAICIRVRTDNVMPVTAMFSRSLDWVRSLYRPPCHVSVSYKKIYIYIYVDYV
jgi:hypothetical protein